MKALLAILALLAASAAQSCRARIPVTLLTASGAAAAARPAGVQVLSPPRARVTALRRAPARRVELLIDGSSGMAAGGLWRTNRRLAEALLATAPRGVRVRLAAFEDKIAPLTPFRAPASGLEDALATAYRGFHPRGGAALYDALALSVAPPTAFRPGDAIVAISGGYDDASGITAAAAARALQASQIRLFLLQLGAPASGEVGALVRDSGGETLPGSTRDRNAVAQRLWQALQGQFWLTLTLARGTAGRLRLRPAPALHGARILAARTPLACR